jgi:hypothetical protein
LEERTLNVDKIEENFKNLNHCKNFLPDGN